MKTLKFKFGLLLLSLLAVLSVSAQSNCAGEPPTSYVSNYNVTANARYNMRAQPRTGCTPIGKMEAGYTGRVVAETGDWRYLKVDQLQKWAWVHKDAFSSSSPTPPTTDTGSSNNCAGTPPTSYVSNYNVTAKARYNMRGQPHDGCTPIGKMEAGYTGKVVAETGDWRYLKVDQLQKWAWVHKDAFSSSSPPPSTTDTGSSNNCAGTPPTSYVSNYYVTAKTRYNMRAQPHDGCTPIGKMEAGYTGKVVAETGDWRYLKVDQLQKWAWVHKDAFSSSSPPPSTTDTGSSNNCAGTPPTSYVSNYYVTAKTRYNMRAQPHDGCTPIGKMEAGYTGKVVAETGDWRYLKVDQLQKWAWVHKDAFSSSSPTPPTTDTENTNNCAGEPPTSYVSNYHVTAKAGYNMRAQPRKGCTPIGITKAGDKGKVIAETGDYRYLKVNEQQWAWVHKDAFSSSNTTPPTTDTENTNNCAGEPPTSYVSNYHVTAKAGYNMRAQPRKGCTPIGITKAGDKGKVIAETGDYRYLKVNEQKWAWVHKDAFSGTTPPSSSCPNTSPTPTTEVTMEVNTQSSSLALRVGPSGDCDRIRWMPKGATVIKEGKSGSWSYVRYSANGQTYRGYASSSFLKVKTQNPTDDCKTYTNIRDVNYKATIAGSPQGSVKMYESPRYPFDECKSAEKGKVSGGKVVTIIYEAGDYVSFGQGWLRSSDINEVSNPNTPDQQSDPCTSQNNLQFAMDPGLYYLDPGESVEFKFEREKNGPFKSVSAEIGVSGLAGIGLNNPILNTGRESEITMTFEVEGQFGQTGEIDAGAVNVGLTSYHGGTLRYAVTMSEDDYNAIKNGEIPVPNLAAPDTWPMGAQVLLTIEMVAGTEYELGYRLFKAASGTEESLGVVVGMTRADNRTIRVYAGDTKSVSQSLALGFGTDDFFLGIGSEHQLRNSRLFFNDIDIVNSDRNSPLCLLASMVPIIGNKDAIINSGKIQLLTFSSASSALTDFKFLGTGFELSENGSRFMEITNKDGTKNIESFASYHNGTQNILWSAHANSTGNITEEIYEYYGTIPEKSPINIYLKVITEGIYIDGLTESESIVKIIITDKFIDELSTRYTEAVQRDEELISFATGFTDLTNDNQLYLGDKEELLNKLGIGAYSTRRIIYLMYHIVLSDEKQIGRIIPFEHLEYDILEP